MRSPLKIFLIIIIFIQGCAKQVPILSDFPGAEAYSKLYIPAAEDNPQTKGISISEIDDTVFCSAYLGGVQTRASDIPIQFVVDPSMVDVYNQAHGTSYNIMPEGSYTLQAPEATIPAGSRSTGSLPIAIHSQGFISPFQTYLLPVTLVYAGSEAQVNSNLNTVYYLLTGSYAPGEVPREHVLKLENGSVSAFQFGTGDNAALIVRHADNNMYRYPLNADGTFGDPQQIGTGWGNVNIFISYGDRWIVRTDDGGMWQYLWTPDGTYLSSNEVGVGWDVFNLIIGYNGNIMSRNIETGEFTRWPFVDCFCGGVFPVNGNWAGFTQIVPYQNTLLGVTPDGDLIEHQISSDGVLGDIRKVGSGWDMYTSIIPFDNDLLALDSEGELWRYKFDPRGNWVLKK